MNVIVCDICGGEIENPVRGEYPGRGVNYIVYLNKDLCGDCMEKVDYKARKVRMEKPQYNFKDAQKIFNDFVLKSCKS